MKLIVFFLLLKVLVSGAEHLPFNNEIYNQVPNNIVRLQSDANEMFMKGYKAFFQQITFQNVPGVKEVTMGYYYDHPTKKLKGVFFTKFESGYPRETGSSLDFAISGDGFFVLQMPNGEEVFTRDGRFQINDNNYLVSRVQGWPVFGENGLIQLKNLSNIDVDKFGYITEDQIQVGKFKIVDFKEKIHLTSITPSLFVMDTLLPYTYKNTKEVSYEIMQGYVEDNSMVKAMAGQMDEYIFGQDANSRVLKMYSRNMSLSIQTANP